MRKIGLIIICFWSVVNASAKNFADYEMRILLAMSSYVEKYYKMPSSIEDILMCDELDEKRIQYIKKKSSLFVFEKEFSLFVNKGKVCYLLGNQCYWINRNRREFFRMYAPAFFDAQGQYIYDSSEEFSEGLKKIRDRYDTFLLKRDSDTLTLWNIFSYDKVEGLKNYCDNCLCNDKYLLYNKKTKDVSVIENNIDIMQTSFIREVCAYIDEFLSKNVNVKRIIFATSIMYDEP